MELIAVQGSTYTPIQLAVLVDGIEQDVSAVTSGSLTIDGVTVTLARNLTTNRMDGVIPASLTDIPGVFTGTGSLVTNTGTYAFPDDGLAFRVLDAIPDVGPVEVRRLLTEISEFLMTEADDNLILET